MSKSQDLGGLLIILGVLVVAVVGAILQMRHEWKALRYRLFGTDNSVSKTPRPGRVAERLASEPWNEAIRKSLEQAREDLAEQSVAAESLARARDELPGVVTSIAREALRAGEPRSTLVRLDPLIVYVLAIPGRPEDRRKFRGYEAFSDGWPAHASAVRQAAVGAEGPPMVGLLYFLGLDARDITLLVAYEGEGVRRYPSDLAEPTDGQGATRGLTHEFAMA